ncbi:MAG: hypothetical protein C0402_13640 [Thermodesulfovibrio sp.]|nr:hypothetical protein [Thermodesulfovibrio sp.]
MTIDTISTTIIPQYLQDERPEAGSEIGPRTGIEANARQQESLQNPLVLRDQARELIDRNGRSRRDDAVVTLTGRQADVPRIQPAVFPSAFVISNALPVYGSDPLFTRVQNAYALFDQKDYKGLYVDKRV